MDEEICKNHCYREKQSNKPLNISANGKIKLIVFDMDGVLADIRSSWRWIHKAFNKDNEASVRAFLRGEIDDEEFVRRDISVWHRNESLVTMMELKEILQDVPLMPGAEECVNLLHKEGITTAIVSAGVDVLAHTIAERLGIDEVIANRVHCDENGRLTGDGTVMVKLQEKGKTVQRLTKKLNIPQENCAAVGNSCFDISMFEACGLGIAFNPSDECVVREADVVIKEKDLRKIIPVLLENSS